MSLNLIVVTPEGEAFSEPVETVVLPGAEGDFGVLESHERFLAPLRPGAMEIRTADGKTEWAGVSGGFAEVSRDQVVVLVDECYHAHEIDLDHALRSKEEAEAAIAEMMATEGELDRLARYEDAAVRAAVQIEVHGKLHL